MRGRAIDERKTCSVEAGAGIGKSRRFEGLFGNFALLSFSGQAKPARSRDRERSEGPVFKASIAIPYLIEMLPTRLPQPLWDAKTWVDDVSRRLL
jgi:hypothetical protein